MSIIVENPIGESGERSDKYKCRVCGNSPSFLYSLTVFSCTPASLFLCKTCLERWIQKIEKPMRVEDSMKCSRHSIKLKKVDLRFISTGPYKFAYETCPECEKAKEKHKKKLLAHKRNLLKEEQNGQSRN